MASSEREGRPDFYVPPRGNKYDYKFFPPEASPEDVLLAKQIQAQSYINMHFVRPDGLVRVKDADGNEVEILAPDIDTPIVPPHLPFYLLYTEYVLGMEKGKSDHDPKTGNMVTWRKHYAPLDAMPAYHFSKENLGEGWEEYLRQVDDHGRLVEIEAMGKTKNAGHRALGELMRNELQRAMGTGEIWFFTIVNQTYEAFVQSWGPTAVRQIGESKQLDHPHVYDHVELIPGVIDVDNFFQNMMHDICDENNPFALKQMRNFLYMTDGIDDARLGDELATRRSDIRRLLSNDQK